MKAAIVYKISIWEIYKDSPDEETRAYLERGGKNLETLQRSSEIQKETLRKTLSALEDAGIDHQRIYRAELTPESIAGADLVISVGGDGTFLEASHVVPPEIPMLGVNSDPERSVGFFAATDAGGIGAVIADLDAQPRTEITRLQAFVEGQMVGPPVLNDVLFAHPNPAATSRYRLLHPSDDPPGEARRFRNSGLLICSAAGSSGWMYQEHGMLMQLDDQRMQFLHRGMRESRPTLTDSGQVEIESLTRRGVVFIDGERTRVPLTLGQRLSVRPGAALTIIGDLAAKRDLD